MKNDERPDMVNSPPHYKRGGMEVIDILEAWELDFRLGNAVAYLLRAQFKGAYVEDLKKARWYIDRALAYQEKQVKELSREGKKP